MEGVERRRSGYLGCWIVLIVVGIAYAILAPVFYSAREAARGMVAIEGGQRLAAAVRVYVDHHGGHLPTGDWKAALRQVDPELDRPLQRIEGDWHTGFAAVPGTKGRILKSLPSETVIYVQYRSAWHVQVLGNASIIGDPYHESSALAITASDLISTGRARPKSSSQIAYELGLQSAMLKSRPAQ